MSSSHLPPPKEHLPSSPRSPRDPQTVFLLCAQPLFLLYIGNYCKAIYLLPKGTDSGGLLPAPSAHSTALYRDSMFKETGGHLL